MTRTASAAHDHDLTAIDVALGGKAPTTHTHPDLEARLAALEKPVIVPAPTTRPFAAPVTTKTVAIPAGSDLAAAIRAASDGTRFELGGLVTLPTGLSLSGRKNLVFSGGGIKNGTTVGVRENSHFYLDHCSDIAFLNVAFEGVNPTPGVYGSSEFVAPIHLLGGARIEMAGGSARNILGDGSVTANGGVTDVWVHDVDVKDAGRNAMSVVWGSRILVERLTVGMCGWAIFDVEPESASNGSSITDIAFLDNATTGWNSDWHGFFFAAAAGGGSTVVVDGLRVERNTVSKNTIQSYIGANQSPFGRRKNVTFRDNKGQAGAIQQGQPGLVTLRHVDGAVLSGNGANPTTGNLYGVVDSTSVVQS